EIMIVGVETETGTMTVIVNKTETMIGQETDAGHAPGLGPETDQGTMIATGVITTATRRISRSYMVYKLQMVFPSPKLIFSLHFMYVAKVW
ncbi:hypothetical protein AALP_AAs49683U000100, partial [Arabis alpina]